MSTKTGLESMESIEQQIVRFLVEESGNMGPSFRLEPGDIKPDSRIDEDLGMDSLDKVEITIRLEEEFEISISDEDAERLVTVKDLVNLVTQKTNAR